MTITLAGEPADPNQDPRNQDVLVSTPIYFGVGEDDRQQIGSFLRREDSAEPTRIEIAGLLRSYADQLANTPDGVQTPAIALILVRP